MSLQEPSAASGYGVPGVDLLRTGAQVGPWRIEGTLGRGGMGTVYAVLHEVIGKRAAMKVIHRHAVTPTCTAERLLIEARAVNAISHPNIVDIFDSGTLLDGRPYLVMERLRGMTLGDRMDEGRIPPVEVIDYLLPLCEALAAAHAVGVVHRDIKLDNVFIVEAPAPHAGAAVGGPTIKLLDWGIASMVDPDGERSSSDLVVGTPRYIAPERARGEVTTPASDVYSLGVVAYEMLLEEPPFHAPAAIDILAMHLYDPPPPPRDVWPQIPGALEDLLLQMLAKRPALRPTIDEVAAVLKTVRVELVARAQAASGEAGAVMAVVEDAGSRSGVVGVASDPALGSGAANAATPGTALRAAIARAASARAAAAAANQSDLAAEMAAEMAAVMTAVPAVVVRLPVAIGDADTGAMPAMSSQSTAIPVAVEPERTPELHGQVEARPFTLKIPTRFRRWRWAAVAVGVFALGLSAHLWLPAAAPPTARAARLGTGTPAQGVPPIAAPLQGDTAAPRAAIATDVAAAGAARAAARAGDLASPGSASHPSSPGSVSDPTSLGRPSSPSSLGSAGHKASAPTSKHVAGKASATAVPSAASSPAGASPTGAIAPGAATASPTGAAKPRTRRLHPDAVIDSY